MVAELTFKTVSKIIDSWETLRRIPNYEEVVGVKIFRRLFEASPSARQVFIFGKEELTEEFYKSKRLRAHAVFFVKMIDRSLALLGPDVELLTDILLELGAKHRNFGVSKSHYPPMGQALLGTVEELLGDKYTDDVKDAWVEVYQAMSYDMIRALNR